MQTFKKVVKGIVYTLVGLITLAIAWNMGKGMNEFDQRIHASP